MKNYHAAGAGLVLFAGGLIAGREFFPTSPTLPPSGDPPALSTRSTTPSRIIEASPPPAEDTSDLLDLVDLNDPFNTTRVLGKALEELDSIQLRNLLTDLESSSKDNPKYHTTRNQIFNHLALADPSLALEILLANSDEHFKQSHLAITIRQLAKSDFATARLAVQNISDKGLKTTALTQLIDAAIEFAPQSVAELIEEAKSQPIVNSFQSYGGYYEGNWGSHPWGSSFQSAFVPNYAISKWADKDPAAAEAYAMGLTDPDQRRIALLNIASAKARADLDGALVWARGLTGGLEREQSIASILQASAYKDPVKVAGMLDQISDPNQKVSIINNIAQSWMKLDPIAGLAWIQSLPSGGGKHQALANALRIVSENDPRAGVALLDQLPSSIRSQNLGQLAQVWAQKDLTAAKAWITTLDNPFDLKTGLDGILSTWAAEDPSGAAAFVQDSGAISPQDRSSQLASIAAQWASKDPSSALQWAQGLEDAEGRNRTLSNIYSQWASKNPEEASSQVSQLTDPDERRNAINNVLSNWTHRDPDAAIQWFNQLPRDERFQSASQLISSLTHQSPENAAAQLKQLAAETGGDEKFEQQLASSASTLASNWSSHDVEAAAEWASGLNDGMARERALGEIASRWANLDPVEASGWIDNLTDGRARDSGVKTLVEKFKGIDPASAFDWARTMSSDSEQISSLRGVLQDWKKTDEAAARQAYSNADLTQKQRDQIDYIFKQ
ncbi:hypothetical protein V2O64_17045 [Verrucomicrobiaceae bacterium 227]